MSAETQKLARIASFLQLAEEELEAADKLSAPLPRQAMYFVQQSVEKLLRAVLEYEGVPAGASHNIRFLSELLPAGQPLKPMFVEFDPLSAASTRYRYPSASGGLSSPTSGDVKGWIARVKKLHKDVRANIRK